MELKSRNVQHARNLFDRAVTLLPRVDQLWYKYVYLEELLQNIPGARQVFERWMQWEPDDKAWQAYIKLEERYQELDRASAIYERWVAVRPDPRVWVKWGKFEEDRGRLDKAREVFQTALEYFGDDEEQVEKAQAVFAAFARIETRLKEFDRARVIYKVSHSGAYSTSELIICSLPSHAFPVLNLPVYMPLTPNLKSNMGHKQRLKALCSLNAVFSMKKSLPTTAEITTSGLIMLGWKKRLCEI